MGTLAWLHAVPGARKGQLLLSVLTMVLIRAVRWGWECSDNSNDSVPRPAGASAGLLRCSPGQAATPLGAWARELRPVDDTSKDNSRMEKVLLKAAGQAHAATGWSINGCAWGRTGVPHSSCPSPTICFHPLFHMPGTLEAAILSEEASGKQLSVTGLKWFLMVLDIHKSRTG